MRPSLHLAVALVLMLASAAGTAHSIVRRAGTDFPIATSVSVPAGADIVFVSGTLADAADPSAPPGSPERIGDTAAQASSVLGKIAAELEAAGFAMSDVVKMNVFLVGDPNKGGAIDFAGLMTAYLKYFGKDAGGLPARTTVQVAGLPMPGALVEIEVIAARAADHAHE
jgi:enamine deaminase RidA (YjgF/YER057c/UK114 family)